MNKSHATTIFHRTTFIKKCTNKSRHYYELVTREMHAYIILYVNAKEERQ